MLKSSWKSRKEAGEKGQMIAGVLHTQKMVMFGTSSRINCGHLTQYDGSNLSVLGGRNVKHSLGPMVGVYVLYRCKLQVTLEFVNILYHKCSAFYIYMSRSLHYGKCITVGCLKCKI